MKAMESWPNPCQGAPAYTSSMHTRLLFPMVPDANSRVEPVKGNIPSDRMNTESQTSTHETSKFEFSLELISDIAQPLMSSLSV
jgi:hypothetical protein